MPSPAVAREDVCSSRNSDRRLRPLKALEVSILFINAGTGDVIFFEHPMMQFLAQLVLIFGIRARRLDLPDGRGLCFDARLYCVLKRVASPILLVLANLRSKAFHAFEPLFPANSP